jgi:hypothetical protein
LQIITAWQCISPEVALKGVKKCCISSAVYGTDDDVWWNVGSESEDNEGTGCEDGNSDTEW